jgi:hypothetical protein
MRLRSAALDGVHAPADGEFDRLPQTASHTSIEREEATNKNHMRITCRIFELSCSWLTCGAKSIRGAQV